ncbi:alpha/beta fold hydrolase [Arsenicicoccus dermatophilus]|uniref:alpha/beta fold hydrolase n=1 Tax=Arsenicicoccus dermatophilus TaxID=1076331 RepID=UPI00391746F6
MTNDGGARRVRGLSRVRRALRRLGVGVLGLVAALTVLALVTCWVISPPDTLAAPDGADVQVAGTRVHYREWGGGPGQPILLIHGFAEHTVVWEPSARLLAGTRRVVAVDLEGHGYTERTGRYDLDHQVALVDGLIAQLGLDRPAVVGHSMGAAVAAGLALHHPDHVGGIVLADGDALPFRREDGSDEPRSGPPSWLLHSPWVLAAYRVGTRWSWLDERIVRQQCGSRCLAVTPELVEAWMRPMRQRSTEQAFPALAGSGVLHLTPDELRRITVPRAIVWGAEDATSGGSLALAQDYLGRPRTIEIPGAGHLVMVADPAAFARAVEQLVAGF